MGAVTVHTGDCATVLADLPPDSVNCCVTSPPYWGLRDYGVDGQLGLEPTPEEYVARMVAVFREVRRVLRDDGTLWLNLGDSYAANVSAGPAQSGKENGKRAERMFNGGYRALSPGIKPKDLVGIPWRVAFALQADGWYLRSDIIWSKPNPMPESVRDRPTKAHEYLFLFAKGQRYWYDAEAVAERVEPSSIARLTQPTIEQQAGSTRVPGKTNGPMKAVGTTTTRNRRTVWTVTTQPFSGAHFAVMPEKLVEPCVLAGCPPKACAVCGSPWVRVVERKKPPAVDPSSLDRYGTGDAGVHRKVGGQYQKWLDAHPAMTIGWQPTCTCDAETAPGTVLDPFTGSGTVGVVAARLGRDFVGIELNPEYAEMARRRIEPVEAQTQMAVTP